MRIYAKIYSIIAVALGAFNACSLIHDDPEDCQLYTPEGVPYAYVAVAFNTGMNTSTRSNPTGGEDGDDLEPGQSNENQVNDITLFFYEVGEGDKGVNMPSTTPIVAWHHFGDEDFDAIPSNNHQIATTKPVEVTKLLVNHSYHVLAVVNGGENFGKDVNTLGDLQQMKVTSIYKTSGSNPTKEGYSNFLMASADDENYPLEIYPSNSETNPAHTVIDVERVSARVDYRAIDPNGQPANDSIYEIDNVGTARITGALLVNTLKGTAENSFLFKRVTLENGAANGNFTWLGDETNDQNGAATNYVLDPLFTSKTGADQSSNYDNYFTGFNYANSNTWESLFIEGIDINGWKCVGYPKENTAVGASKYHTTGIVFKAAIMLNEKDKPVTFFEWKGKLYNTVEEIMQAFDPTNWNDRIAETNQWTTVASWDDLRSIIIAHLKDDPAGYKDFLALMAEGKNGAIADKSVLRWSSYMRNNCFYEENNGSVRVDVGEGTPEGKTRQILAEKAGNEGGGIRTYKDGICYYTYWIKHANNNEDGDDMPLGKGGIMEYGIVRNNVYKLNVTSISEVGDDIPGDRTLEINVSVKNWEVIEGEDEIELQPNTGE